MKPPAYFVHATYIALLIDPKALYEMKYCTIDADLPNI